MKRGIRAREHKLAGYVHYGLKSHILAIATSPAVGQNMHIQHGESKVEVRYHIDRSLVRFVTRIQGNIYERKGRTHDELLSNCVFSKTWSSTYLIHKGQALVDQFHSQRLVLKSARLRLDC